MRRRRVKVRVTIYWVKTDGSEVEGWRLMTVDRMPTSNSDWLKLETEVKATLDDCRGLMIRSATFLRWSV